MESLDLPMYQGPEFAMDCELLLEPRTLQNNVLSLIVGGRKKVKLVEREYEYFSKTPNNEIIELAFRDAQNRMLIELEPTEEQVKSIKVDTIHFIKTEEFPLEMEYAFLNNFNRKIKIVAKSDLQSPVQQNFAKPPFFVKLKEGTVLFHYSAFSNPIRIPKANSKTGQIVAGTYFTSESESLHCTSGFAVVGRFALPSNASAHYRHQIILEEDIEALVGTVMPNFGFAGGGVEIFTLQPITKYRWGMQEIPMF